MFEIVGMVVIYGFLIWLCLFCFVKLKNYISKSSSSKTVVNIVNSSAYSVAYERIKYERHEEFCEACRNNFTYTLRDLYEEFGNCGGYSDYLHVDCTYCGNKIIMYKSHS